MALAETLFIVLALVVIVVAATILAVIASELKESSDFANNTALQQAHRRFNEAQLVAWIGAFSIVLFIALALTATGTSGRRVFSIIIIAFLIAVIVLNVMAQNALRNQSVSNEIVRLSRTVNIVTIAAIVLFAVGVIIGVYVSLKGKKKEA